MIENLEQKVFKKFDSYNDDLLKLQNDLYKLKSEFMIMKNAFDPHIKQITVNTERIDNLFLQINDLNKADKLDQFSQMLKDELSKLKDYVDSKLNEYQSTYSLGSAH
jgi:cob(I)alamin adenosyltransferase